MPVSSVAQAKTGTGKTLAFLIPVIQRIIANQPELGERGRGPRRARSNDIRAIVLSPTRELAEQIAEEARKVTRMTGVIVQAAVGGTQKNAMLRKTRMEGCHLLVATPGRLHDLLSDPYSGIDAPKLEALVLDEADRMLEVGFEEQLQRILEFLPAREQVPRQTLLYSATLPKNVVGLARSFINPKNFEFVQTVKVDEVPTHEKVPQFIVPCRGFENLAPALLELVRRELQKRIEDKSLNPFKAIIFLPTTSLVVAYASIFRRIRYHDNTLPAILDIHSGLSQGERTRSAQYFRNAKSAILFSSDVTARGMDFPNVSHVIQIHMPNSRENYIHRLGRTGRAGKEGQGWLLLADIEIPAARDTLPGLPIQRCTDIESAALDASVMSEPTKVFREVQEGAQKLPFETLREAYTSFLGGAVAHIDRQDLVNEINSMCKYAWGMPEPPAINPKLARNMGRGLKGLRISDGPATRYIGGVNRNGGRGHNQFHKDEFERMESLAAQAERRGSRSRGRALKATF